MIAPIYSIKVIKISILEKAESKELFYRNQLLIKSTLLISILAKVFKEILTLNFYPNNLKLDSKEPALKISSFCIKEMGYKSEL